MKNILWLAAGLSAAIAYVLLSKARTASAPIPLEDLAHKLQDAWADHHTVA